MFERIKEFINPEQNPNLTVPEEQQGALPTLWLLGKTGAGKSSIIQALTGLDEVEVGNGFAPCTQTSYAWDFPQDKPVLRFLDTRGLGEAYYDPAEDIEVSSAQSHALLIVAKAEEPEQSAVLEALKQIRKQKHIKHVLLIHTAINAVNETDKGRVVAYNQTQFEKAWGEAITAVEVDFNCAQEKYANRDGLAGALINMLPILGLMLATKSQKTEEESNFDELKTEVLWYAMAASTTDLLPAVGLVTVPALQAKMLHSLANQYGVPWSLKTFTEFVSVLGASFGIQYGVRLSVRQLAKFIPVYGQTVGALAAATVSFGTTYALGRAANYYFYRISRGESVDTDSMQRMYKEAFERGKKAAEHEAS